MDVVDLPLSQLREAPWNPNRGPDEVLGKLRESISRYGLVENLVVRPPGDGTYEVLSGNQRLGVLREMEVTHAPCVVVQLDDAQARLLSQAMNRLHGEDDLGLRAELIREVLVALPQEEVLSILPETSTSLQALSSLGQQDMASYIQAWERAQAARLKHLTFQLTADQLEVVEEALRRMLPRASETEAASPNRRGTALYLLCKTYLERAGALP